MQYLEINIPVLDEKKEVLMAELELLGFESFWDKGSEVAAYIIEENFNHKLLYDKLAKYGMENSFSISKMENKNWNEEWESNYEPILIGSQVFVRSPFHEPNSEVNYEVIIQPQMSFGTGHHQTTQLVIEMMLTTDFTKKSVLDMGSGTGVLAILAEKMGASHVVAIDYDENCVENAAENLKYNGSENVKILQGSHEAIPDQEFDVVLSNITKNINVGLIPFLAKATKKGGQIILAGFLNFDLEEIDNIVCSHGFAIDRNISKGDWECLMYTKK
ncbi:MAG: 50S ribosomal protein L11 methyltransferase [Flavobacteriales bacterium]|nr:50S ribosomal protein L11 methyltransferase [Flavobacteriales bacterium]